MVYQVERKTTAPLCAKWQYLLSNEGAAHDPDHWHQKPRFSSYRHGSNAHTAKEETSPFPKSKLRFCSFSLSLFLPLSPLHLFLHFWFPFHILKTPVLPLKRRNQHCTASHALSLCSLSPTCLELPLLLTIPLVHFPSNCIYLLWAPPETGVRGR